MTEARGSAGLSGTGYTPGTPCWMSLMVHGMTATQEFYGALFGWKFQPRPQQWGPYVRAVFDGHEVAGIGQLPPDPPVRQTALDEGDTAGGVDPLGSALVGEQPAIDKVLDLVDPHVPVA